MTLVANVFVLPLRIDVFLLGVENIEKSIIFVVDGSGVYFPERERILVTVVGSQRLSRRFL